MYYVSTQDVDERTINVQDYDYYYKADSPVQHGIFFPRVNFQCIFSCGICTAPVCTYTTQHLHTLPEHPKNGIYTYTNTAHTGKNGQNYSGSCCALPKGKTVV